MFIYSHTILGCACAVAHACLSLPGHDFPARPQARNPAGRGLRAECPPKRGVACAHPLSP
eukprot:4374756-Alexandrium_andersonii.AAC.1